MSESIISVENLSKRYIIGHHRDKGDGLRHRLENTLHNSFSWLWGRKRKLQAGKEEFWALQDVSFEIQQGDVVGIIGRNGAGKSTLLKILSRITEPTKGRIRIKGRVASLLEVGTGFHQELTGRENIFLNGAILGMSRVEIKKKFDEIVAFSEVEKFLDTPVKRYSSGMYVRLAFAVAAHLEPEILIVDEVLAVGDAQFQKKCLGKMQEVSKVGRTVIFVSHNMAAVRQLCSTGLLLTKGAVQKVGSINEVVESYMTIGVEYHGNWKRQELIPDAAGIYFEEVCIFNKAGELAGHFDCSSEFTVRLRVRATERFARAQIVIRFTNQDGIPVLSTCNTDVKGRFVVLEKGRHQYSVQLPGNFFSPGTYMLQIAVHNPRHRLFDIIDNTMAVCIEKTGDPTSLLLDDRQGVVNPIFNWRDEFSL